jgi:hypothetical protein
MGRTLRNAVHPGRQFFNQSLNLGDWRREWTNDRCYSFNSRSRINRDCRRLIVSSWPVLRTATCVPPAMTFTFRPFQQTLRDAPSPTTPASSILISGCGWSTVGRPDYVLQPLQVHAAPWIHGVGIAVVLLGW